VREAINQVTSMLREDLINQSFQRGSQYAVNYSEDPFPELFSPTAGYTPTFGRSSTMDPNDIFHYSSQASSRLWESPVCLCLLPFPSLCLVSLADIHSINIATCCSKKCK